MEVKSRRKVSFIPVNPKTDVDGIAGLSRNLIHESLRIYLRIYKRNHNWY